MNHPTQNPGIPSHQSPRVLPALRTAVYVALTAVLFPNCFVLAMTFPLPADNEALIGQINTTQIKAGETLLDVARRYDLGLNEMAAANPGVDPWLPEPGRELIVPSQFILPDAPRKGIVINLPEMRLYYYPDQEPDKPRQVITHPLGIGSEGRLIPLMNTTITDKRTDPSWYVPESIRAEHSAQGDPLPKVVPPGPDNPLGAYSMRLGTSSYLVHGTNQPYSIGIRASHGCLRMYPEDIERFYQLVALGTPVRIVNQPYKAGWSNHSLYLETHPLIAEATNDAHDILTQMVKTIIKVTINLIGDDSWEKATSAAGQANGIPVAIHHRNQTGL